MALLADVFFPTAKLSQQRSLQGITLSLTLNILPSGAIQAALAAAIKLKGDIMFTA